MSKTKIPQQEVSNNHITLNDKIVFGLKVKQLRRIQGLSFQDLSELSGLSVSYLNEIEKGKKYPRTDKIRLLADALRTSIEELTSGQLSHELLPLAELLHSNFLNELPLDLFGVDKAKLVEIIAEAPAKVNAFISALMDISRRYYFQREHFYFAALRSYQELHFNFFEEIEAAADELVRVHHLSAREGSHLPADVLLQVLQKEYRYKVAFVSMEAHPALKGLRSYYHAPTRRLLVNDALSETQKAFVLGKELGYSHLKLKERTYASTFLRVRNFEEVLNNFFAAYFAGCLLVNRWSLVEELRAFFCQTTWDADGLPRIMRRYNASAEMLGTRLTSVLPRYFGLTDLFSFRFNHAPSSDKYQMTKELHLSRQHRPHGNDVEEHYCRRWISIWLLEDFHRAQITNPAFGEVIFGAQVSHFFGTNDQYLCLSIARNAHPTPHLNISSTVGIRVNDQMRRVIRFMDDPALAPRVVNETCERCSIADCKERAAAPTVLNHKGLRQAMEDELEKLLALNDAATDAVR